MQVTRLLESGRAVGNGTLIACVALVGVLFFTWPIPHTTSLRDLLLVACLAWFGSLTYRDRPSAFAWRRLRVPLGLYIVLSLWIVFVALVVSDETAWTLGEIKGQWLRPTVALVVGGLLGLVVRGDEKAVRLVLAVVGAALLLHVFYVVYQSLRVWSISELLTFGDDIDMLEVRWYAAGLTGGPDKSNYLTNMLLYFLLAEVFVRLVSRRRFLPVGNIPLIAAVALAVFSVYVEAVRNGIAELIVVFCLAIVLGIHVSDRAHRPAIAGATFALLVVTLVLGYLAMHQDKRWQTFIETVPIALDIENNKAWINEKLPQPRLADGKTVNWSNYSRIARIRAGLSLMADYPLGVGFGRNAFGHAVEKKYGMKTSHSHSGIIDLGVGVGIPGVVLWLGFLGALARIGYRGLRASGGFASLGAAGSASLYRGFPALVLLLLTAGYGFRMLVDSTIRDHMLQMFLFLAAFLAVVTVGRSGRGTTPA